MLHLASVSSHIKASTKRPPFSYNRADGQWVASLQSNALTLAGRKPRISPVIILWVHFDFIVGKNLLHVSNTITNNNKIVPMCTILGLYCWPVRWLEPHHFSIGKSHQSKVIESRTKWQPFLQTTFSNPFSWMKMVGFRFKFHWNLFPEVQLTMNHHWFR